MIPLKLTLHNFMCYRDPAPLDFSGMHLACLSGNNGHGKSAILDAMTWALWGKARSNQADELIHLGQMQRAAVLLRIQRGPAGAAIFDAVFSVAQHAAGGEFRGGLLAAGAVWRQH